MDMAQRGGGSLLLAWQLKNRRVLIVGGGDVASSRIQSVLATDAQIIVICPREGLHVVTRSFVDTLENITYHDRLFAGPSDLVNVDMVLTAIDDVDKSREICALCRQLRVPINAADLPDLCDFYFGSHIRNGPLQIMISTNGNGPKLANIIRKRIEKSLPVHAGQAIEKVGLLRKRLRERAPGVGGELAKRRMSWMSELCSAWELEDLALLDDRTIQSLLENGWEKNTVPRPQDVGQGRLRQSLIHSLGEITRSSSVAFLAGAVCASLLIWARFRT